MISSLGLNFYKVGIVLILAFLNTGIASAQDRLTLSITPPLFRLNIESGETWSSSIKVINNNPYDITVYPVVVNFESNGENGYGNFTPILEEDRNNPDLLANWIKIDRESVAVPREQSAGITFTVNVPQDASPGGHYAAILIGTKPQSRSGGTDIGVSSFVSSLLLIKVGGDIIERGDIREFSTDKSFYDKPEATFNLRFENSGNVHIIPRGDIAIYNMWGKERGRILINKDSDFGNVLPDSIRKFSFIWKGDEDRFEIGRYKAVVTLSFGGEENQTVSRTISFWVVPLGPTLKFAGIVLGFLLFMTWSIKAYVRRALGMYKIKTSAYSLEDRADLPEESNIDVLTAEIFAGPLKEGIVDLRRVSGQTTDSNNKVKKISLAEFIKQYKKALVFTVGGLVSVVSVSAYLIEVRSPIKDYTVSARSGDAAKGEVTTIKVIAGHSSEEGVRIKKILEKNGISVGFYEKSYENTGYTKTIIRYIPKYVKEAQIIGKIIGSDNILEEVLDQENDVVIIVSEDINNN